jgi:phage recombination protein Bet
MESTASLAKIDRNQSILATYTNEQVAVIKQHVAQGATNDELVYFLQVCKAQNLDPFSKQIYFVKRGTQMNIQTGIDGYRAIAEQSGKLAGIDDPIFDTETAKHPAKATVTVYKFVKGQKVPFTASARWLEYYPGDKMGFMWNKMPYLMLGKVAEALALRKAFPKNLGNIYTEEELQSSNYVPVSESNADQLKSEQVPDMSTDQQRVDLNRELIRVGKTVTGLLAHLKKEKLADLTYKEAVTWITSLKSQPSMASEATQPAPDSSAPANSDVPDSQTVVEGEIIEDMPPKPEKPKAAPKAAVSPAPVDDVPPPVDDEGPMKRARRVASESKMREESFDGFAPIPEDVCKLINFYEGVDDNNCPQGFKQLRDDCNSGQFKGKTSYNPHLFV